MGYYPMQGGQMQSPQSEALLPLLSVDSRILNTDILWCLMFLSVGHVYQQQFMGGQPPPHFSVVPQPGQPGGPAPGANDGQH
jgi:hypothetical protein